MAGLWNARRNGDEAVALVEEFKDEIAIRGRGGLNADDVSGAGVVIRRSDGLGKGYGYAGGLGSGPAGDFLGVGCNGE